ncbi:MAG: hypothetical protein ACFFDW_05670, partial [Candidatus Thorarchaeota archaeon]
MRVFRYSSIVLVLFLFIFSIPLQSKEITNDINNSYFYPNSIGFNLSWSFNSSCFSNPIAVDLEKDGTLELLVLSSSNKFYCLNHLGEIEWEYGPV